MDRYNRQQIIKGWDQKKLTEARVVIYGTGTVANYAIASLAALGVGTLEIYSHDKSNKSPSEWLHEYPQMHKAISLEKKIEAINSEVNIKGMDMVLNTYTLPLLDKPDVIIDTHNNSRQRGALAKYAKENSIPVYWTLASENDAYLSTNLEGFARYKNKNQNAVTSAIISGVLAEEIRKILMPFENEAVPLNNLSYSLDFETRFGKSRKNGHKSPKAISKHVLIVGAGALGNFVGLSSTLSNVERIDIMDFDEVDSTNLNRQILFYDAVGQQKSSALVQKLKSINPNTEINAIDDKVDHNLRYFNQNSPDLIYDCVDSFAARAYINYFAVRNNIPLVSGGTNPRSGQVVAYQPEYSACLDCKLGVETALAKELKAASCKFAPDPSVIMTNQVIGNMMVGEGNKILNGEKAVNRILKYDSQVATRGGLIGASEACNCKKPGMRRWLSSVRKLA